MNLQEKSFDNRVKEAMRTTAEQILASNLDSITKIEPIVNTSPMFFVCEVNTPIDSFLLGSLLKYEFKYQDITVDYNYGIYDCFSDSITLSRSVVDQKETNNLAELPKDNPKFDKSSANFWIYFPQPKGFLISQMGKWLFTSVILLIMAALTFSYTIFTIIKQKKLSEIKTDFINNMTHELKTPISTIGLSSEILMKPEIQKDQEKIHKYATIISDENDRLKNQVEKVLQMAIIDRSVFELNKRKLDIHDIIANTVEKLQLTISNRNGSLIADLQADGHLISGDWEHLQNVITNLLDNANKYSPEDPTIAVSTKDYNNGIVIVVSDRGIGMSKESQKKVFDKFYRVHTGDVHNVKGFGLGLNYVKIIAKAHGGDVTVHSKLGEGSTFELYLPNDNN